LPRTEEACPNGLAPTTSTLMQLALGDALAVALLEDRGFTAQDFRVYHPGGRLGAMLVTVDDLMHEGAAMPLAPEGATLGAVIDEMTAKGLGCCGLVDGAGALVGLLTDGDLRRAMGRADRTTPAAAIMTRHPKVSARGRLASEILDTMNTRKITAVFVVEAGRPVGLVHIHDLLRAGVA
jgi:arabinose-5-phosphate isomerase